MDTMVVVKFTSLAWNDGNGMILVDGRRTTCTVVESFSGASLMVERYGVMILALVSYDGRNGRRLLRVPVPNDCPTIC